MYNVEEKMPLNNNILLSICFILGCIAKKSFFCME